MTEMSRLDFLKLVHVLLTWQIVLKAIKVQFIVCKHVLRYSCSEKDRPRSGRPQIKTPREVRFMVTSSRRYRFIAAPKHVERLRHATGRLMLRFYCQKASGGRWTEI